MNENEFNKTNTEGFSKAELYAMNRELEYAMKDISEDDEKYHQELKNQSEIILDKCMDLNSY